jgi:hypothetical protein
MPDTGPNAPPISFKRVRTTLYGDQRLLPGELDLLHTRTLQRLYDLRQLGFTDRVFIDASHLRIHHVVGTLEQVDRILEAIDRNLERYPDRELPYGGAGGSRIRAAELAGYVRSRRPVVRLMALLHDATHAPFGHTLEDEIHLVSPGHDDPDRQARVFYRLLCEYVGWLARDGGFNSFNSRPEKLADFLDSPDYKEPPELGELDALVEELLRADCNHVGLKWMLPPDQVARLLAQAHMAMTALLHLKDLEAVSSPAGKQEGGTAPWRPVPRSGYNFQLAVAAWLKSAGRQDLLEDSEFDIYKDAWMLDVVGNTVCADLLDYAKRDARNAGINLDYDDKRIVENFTIVSWSPPDDDPQARCFLRAAVSVFSHKFRTDVPGELMNLLNVRYYIYERAVYHSTKCAADAMLGTALQLLGLGPTASCGVKVDSTVTKNGRVAPDASGGSSQSVVSERLARLGDSVFLHVVTEAARLALHQGTTSSGACPGSAELLEGEVAREILQAVGTGEDGKKRIRAGLDLLVRLAARRYYRLVFRTLPTYEQGHISAADLERAFRDAGRRYEAEREIERRARLPLGAVVIHCPKITTARKVAATLVVNRSSDGRSPLTRPRRLEEISQLEPKGIFQKHEEAVRAVEDMYKSMWRLTVYVSPEHLHERGRIVDAASQVLWERARPASETGAGVVSNDQMLELELSAKEAEWQSYEAAMRSVAAAGPVEGVVTPRVAGPRPAADGELIRDARLYRLWQVLYTQVGADDFDRACKDKGLGDLVMCFDDQGFAAALDELRTELRAPRGPMRMSAAEVVKRLRDRLKPTAGPEQLKLPD